VIVLWLFVGLSISLADVGAERLLSAGCNLTFEAESNVPEDCAPLGLCFISENITASISYFQRDDVSVFRCENVSRADWVKFALNYYPTIIHPYSSGNIAILNLANALDRVYSFWWIALSFLKEGKGKKSQNARLVVGAVLASLWSAFLVGVFLFELGELASQLNANGFLVVSEEMTILAVVATCLLILCLLILIIYGIWYKKTGSDQKEMLDLAQQFDQTFPLSKKN
jgi:hypothetical protein